jgi:hypothetical protein
LGHGRQQARRARLGLASSGHNYLARLPCVYELVAARQTCGHPYLGAQRTGRSDRSKDRTAQADACSRERGAHGAQITSGTAPGIPVYVHPAGEPASRGGTPAFTPCYSSMDGSRHRGGPPARLGASGADRRGLSGRLLLLSCTGAGRATPGSSRRGGPAPLVLVADQNRPRAARAEHPGLHTVIGQKGCNEACREVRKRVLATFHTFQGRAR